MFRRSLFLLLFLLFFTTSSLSNPPTSKATCYYPGDAGYSLCVSGYPSSGSTYCCLYPEQTCPNIANPSSNPTYACCTNKPGTDTCPPLNSLTPTPTIDPAGDCGENSEPCCGDACIDPNDTCVLIPLANITRCLTAEQISLIPGAPDPTSNTYQCGWNPNTGHCNLQSEDCDTGFTHDNNVCLGMDYDACISSPPQPCISGEVPPPVYQVPTDFVPIFCTPGEPDSGIRTAIGCIQASNPQALTVQVISFMTKVVGGILFLNVAYAGFLYTTAAGNEKRAKEGLQLLSSSVQGLLFILTAVLILNFIGIKILGMSLLGFKL